MNPKTHETFFFGEPDRLLFGVLERPTGAPRAGLVLVNPYGEETVNTYNRLSRWGKNVARDSNIAVLRFHPYGTGESDGTHADYNLEGAASDLTTALAHFRTLVPDAPLVAVLGVRFGAAIALCAAKRAPFDALAMWCPVANLKAYARELLRFKATTNMVQQKQDGARTSLKSMVADLTAGKNVDIVDYLMSPASYEQMLPVLGFPEEPPAKRIAILARPEEDGDVVTQIEGWRQKGASVLHQVHKVPVFWENFTGGLPDPFTDATLPWLLEGKAS